MSQQSDTLEKLQAIASIASSIAVPVIIAILGWWLQAGISKQGIEKDYVQIASNILKEPPSSDEDNEELRIWAIAVLDKYAPIPFSASLRRKLQDGKFLMSETIGNVPYNFMEPPKPVLSIPDAKKTSSDNLRKVYADNILACQTNTLTLNSLQELLIAFDKTHLKYATEYIKYDSLPPDELMKPAQKLAELPKQEYYTIQFLKEYYAAIILPCKMNSTQLELLQNYIKQREKYHKDESKKNGP
ncbi:MAG: hypothetical protein JO089_03910 [Alphaproteobacteria bacterium]|nr:hypothetical protein [Alphaproteobacteria bacterium]